MAIGASIQSAEGRELSSVSVRLGEGTNNIAEYQAAIAGVRKAIEHEADEIELRMDSQLVIKQVNEEWEVRKSELVPLRDELLNLLSRYTRWSAIHVRRELNQRADELANVAYSS